MKSVQNTAHTSAKCTPRGGAVAWSSTGLASSLFSILAILVGVCSVTPILISISLMTDAEQI